MYSFKAGSNLREVFDLRIVGTTRKLTESHLASQTTLGTSAFASSHQKNFLYVSLGQEPAKTAFLSDDRWQKKNKESFLGFYFSLTNF